jgi:ribosomal protein S18 acetylase RimI-like enzyme
VPATLPAPVSDPAPIRELYERDRPVHPYGLADLVQFWDVSRWWRDGDAAVGILDLPGSPVPVVYAVTARAVAASLDLLAALVPVLPDHFVITGPPGLTARLAPVYSARWSDAYQKMHLARPDRLPPEAPDIVDLGADDLPALERLYATDPDAGDFFHVGLVTAGRYVGRWADGELLAAAGTHIVDPVSGVAAIGNVATRPDHRRRGLGQAVVGALCHRLLAEVRTVGLNVRDRTPGARALYSGLGFEVVAPYEEAELLRLGPPAPDSPQ